jgi:cytidylate kinase
MAIISICRGTKSGGKALAQCLAEQLGYPLLGREVLQDAAGQLGVPPGDLIDKFEGKPSLFNRAATLRKTYLAAVQATLAEQMVGGDLIYHGLAGGFLLKDVPGVLCARLIAPMDMRIQALLEEHGMSEAEAAAYIKEVDDGRVRWVKTMYDADIHDPVHYDLVLNLGTFSVSEACAILTATAKRPEFGKTKENLAGLENFSVASHVRLALMDDMGTQTLDLHTRALAGVVEVTGQAPLTNTGEIGNRITEIANAVSGVKEVVLKIEWFDPYP